MLALLAATDMNGGLCRWLRRYGGLGSAAVVFVGLLFTSCGRAGGGPEVGAFAVCTLFLLGHVLIDEVTRRGEVTHAADADYLRALLASLPDGVLITDRAGNLVQTNPALRTLAGEDPPRTAEDRLVWWAEEGEDHRRFTVQSAPLYRAGMYGESRDLLILVRPPGQDRQLRLNLRTAPVRDGRGRIIGAVGVFRDLTELDRLHAIEIENLHRREEFREVRLQFLSMVAHELRAPLASILGYTNLLTRLTTRQPALVEQEPRLGKYAGELTVAVGRMRHLIDNLADVSRIKAGHLELRPALCDLVPLVRQTVKWARQERRTLASHAILVDVPAHLWGSWDAQRLDQILTNLLENAVKYSPEGGRIVVGARAVGGEARIEVSDQGIGIPHDLLPDRIFEPWVRGAPGGIDGEGLGLYIVKAMVEAHGGTIAVRSAVGMGTTFVVTLPGVREDVAAESEATLVTS